MKAQLSIFGVQPLTYSNDVRERLFIEFISYNPCIPQTEPDWILNLEKLYQNEHNYSFLIQNSESVQLLGCDFTFSAYLLGNTRLNLFTIVFELQSKYFVNNKLDANAVRQMLVLSDSDQRLPIVKSAIKKACEAAAMMASVGYDDIVVKNDSCNVTIFIRPDSQEGLPVMAQTCHAFIDADDSERMSIRREELEISERTIILFGGRVHLVASFSDGDVLTIKNVLFNLQFMWFFVPIYLRDSSKLHLNIVSGNANYSSEELEEKSVNLSYIAQTLKLQNESAKISYETFSKKFYERIEDSWGVEKSLNQFANYASFFEVFIKNTREKQARKADEILNYVLAALAIFGVVGFWADILDAEHTTHEWGTFGRFAHAATDSFFGFTTIIFILIGITAATLLIYNSIRLKHGKRRGDAK